MRVLPVVVLVAVACGQARAPAAPDGSPGPSPAQPPAAVTPNDFLARGLPTFVLGTAGDDRADQRIAGQVALVRGLLFASAPIVTDTSIAAARGLAAWPPRPVLYGGPHTNTLVAAIAPTLPFSLGPGRLVIGGEAFAGDDVRLVAVVPARSADARGPATPELLLYAGTGDPGVAEINAPTVSRGTEPIVVADAFGPLRRGRFVLDAQGAVTAELGPPARRIAWRAVERELAGTKGRAPVRILFPAILPKSRHEEATIEACMRGLTTVVRRLALAKPTPLAIYVYPDRRSKASLTGDGGDGHAVPAARVLHVLVADPAPAGALEGLVAHEGTHVLAYEAWGSAGTPLLGEGLAVWVSGRYAGLALSAWSARLATRAPLGELVSAHFRRLPERASYPQAGLFVEAVHRTLGLAGLRALYGASADTFEAACQRAGAAPARLWPRP